MNGTFFLVPQTEFERENKDENTRNEQFEQKNKDKNISDENCERKNKNEKSIDDPVPKNRSECLIW